MAPGRGAADPDATHALDDSLRYALERTVLEEVQVVGRYAVEFRLREHDCHHSRGAHSATPFLVLPLLRGVIQGISERTKLTDEHFVRWQLDGVVLALDRLPVANRNATDGVPSPLGEHTQMAGASLHVGVV